jgi:hypothetical protein
MADGHNRRCYCNNADYCNGATRRTVVALTGLLLAAVSSIFITVTS